MKPIGWRGESYRHYLSSKGVRTNFHNRAYLMATIKRVPQYQIKEIETRLGKEAAEEARRVALAEQLTAKQLAERYDVPYVRVLPVANPNPERAYVGVAAVEPIKEGRVRGEAPVTMTDEQRLREALIGEGRAEFRRQKEDTAALEAVAYRRVEGIENDLAEGEGILGGAGHAVLQSRLSSATENLAWLRGRLEKLKDIERRGAYDEVLSASQRDAVADRLLRQPKREAAILDVIDSPVQPVELSQEQSWRRGDRKMQTRITKFFVKKHEVAE